MGNVVKLLKQEFIDRLKLDVIILPDKKEGGCWSQDYKTVSKFQIFIKNNVYIIGDLCLSEENNSLYKADPDYKDIVEQIFDKYSIVNRRKLKKDCLNGNSTNQYPSIIIGVTTINRILLCIKKIN